MINEAAPGSFVTPTEPPQSDSIHGPLKRLRKNPFLPSSPGPLDHESYRNSQGVRGGQATTGHTCTCDQVTWRGCLPSRGPSLQHLKSGEEETASATLQSPRLPEPPGRVVPEVAVDAQGVPASGGVSLAGAPGLWFPRHPRLPLEKSSPGFLSMPQGRSWAPRVPVLGTVLPLVCQWGLGWGQCLAKPPSAAPAPRRDQRAHLPGLPEARLPWELLVRAWSLRSDRTAHCLGLQRPLASAECLRLSAPSTPKAHSC